eukprot:Mycagemm_TRINITY_DN9879_c0_g2::TRINITY_DN9879_c0_g2_i2::g.212::m.212 type:complete len:116 gc:universal TRINITY_DN9879_c0_g2_i2:352-5(-)
MVTRRYGEHVRADLVGCAAVIGHAISTHHHRTHALALHERCAHAVGDESRGNLIVHQLVGRQPCALHVGSCLGAVHVHAMRLLGPLVRVQCTDDAQCRAKPGSGECASVAVREHG